MDRYSGYGRATDKVSFRAQDPLHLEDLVDFEEAVGLYRTVRRQGLTLRSSIDCLIAACALRHDLTVLHRDRDFDRLARVSALKQKKPSNADLRGTAWTPIPGGW